MEARTKFRSLFIVSVHLFKWFINLSDRSFYTMVTTNAIIKEIVFIIGPADDPDL